VFGVLTDGRRGRGVAVMPILSMEPAHYLLSALVTQVGGADHQDRREQPRHELTEQQRGGKDEQQLVAQGSDGDPLDHRQLALGGNAVDVLRGHSGVVDHDTRGFGGRASGCRADVVDGGGREPCQRRNVIEEPEQPRTHRVPSMTSKGTARDEFATAHPFWRSTSCRGQPFGTQKEGSS
jgi:hypothetical protein